MILLKKKKWYPVKQEKETKVLVNQYKKSYFPFCLLTVFLFYMDTKSH